MHAHNSNTQSGFTLIEMIVSLAVFSVVITMSVGALLMLVASNSQLQKEQSIMTNLSFAIDSMTREIRTGTLYFCASASNQNTAVPLGPGSLQIFRGETDIDTPLKNETRDCEDGRTNSVQGISFKESGNSITGSSAERILYFYDESDGKIYRRISGQEAQSIVSSGIYITNAEFFVTGSTPGEVGVGNYRDQPTVTIFIEARETENLDGKPYQIQTMVTQRTLDI